MFNRKGSVVRQNQARNIPSKMRKGELQKPAILATSKLSLMIPLTRSWSFWVFVQILGFLKSVSDPPYQNAAAFPEATAGQLTLCSEVRIVS
jgi:hypothetical protein